jgi:hypothetical protein
MSDNSRAGTDGISPRSQRPPGWYVILTPPHDHATDFVELETEAGVSVAEEESSAQWWKLAPGRWALGPFPRRRRWLAWVSRSLMKFSANQRQQNGQRVN